MIEKVSYLNIASMIVIQLISFIHFTIAQLHDFEDVVPMFFLNKLDVHVVELFLTKWFLLKSFYKLFFFIIIIQNFLNYSSIHLRSYQY